MQQHPWGAEQRAAATEIDIANLFAELELLRTEMQRRFAEVTPMPASQQQSEAGSLSDLQGDQTASRER